MNIYQFINSRDIAEHWEKIGYEPSALESAWLVWQSKNHTLIEKHAAWRDIIAALPDCAICNEFYPQDSLHSTLEKYMKIERHLISEFYKDESDAVYTYRMHFDDSEYKWFDSNTLFYTFEEAYTHAHTEDDPCPGFVEFVKTYIGEDGKQIIVRFNIDREIVHVNQKHYLNDDADGAFFQYLFCGMWFAFPTPFKKGDILETVIGKCCPSSYKADTFVMMSICTEGVYNSDMTAYGYFVAGMGELYQECIHNYMDLKYVCRELKDEERLFIPISRYLKGEIDLGLLLGAYRIILCETEANDVDGFLNYTGEGKRIAGLKNEA